MKLLTLIEAAVFLRMSKSSLYQRKNVPPRYRRPGSRVILFDQDELEAWLMQGRIGGQGEPAIETPTTSETRPPVESGTDIVDISSQRVYHRRSLYR